MKTLELNKMERIEAGGWVSCFGAAVGIASITALTIAGGPVGWSPGGWRLEGVCQQHTPVPSIACSN